LEVAMALRNIVVEGDEILRKKCREVTQIDDRIRGILDDMLETMREYDGVGIAAPQVGIMRRIFIIEVEEGEVIELINPEILETRGSVGSDEGCLSVPGYVGYVERPEYVKITGLDRYGNQVIHEGEGLKAVALCHENDHLDGVLYVDKATDVRKVEE
jgi:peptide deformylase